MIMSVFLVFFNVKWSFPWCPETLFSMTAVKKTDQKETRLHIQSCRSRWNQPKSIDTSRSSICHRFWNCYKTLRFCSLLARCRIPCTCHAKSHLNLQKWSERVVFLTFWLGNVLRATTAYTFSTSQLPKVLRAPGVLYILTSKCASRHNGVHFFDIWTSKSAPKPSVFYTFDFEMCFAPQWCALFRHLNFQKWFEHEVLCAFWLPNVLCATTVCNFSSLIWPDGSAPAA